MNEERSEKGTERMKYRFREIRRKGKNKCVWGKEGKMSYDRKEGERGIWREIGRVGERWKEMERGGLL